MIITLTKDIVKNIGFLKYIFMEKIELEEKNIKNKVKLLNIKIKTRNGKINWKKINKFFKNSNVEVLCSEDIEIPDNLNFKKFYSSKYKKRLCINAALETLKLADINANYIKILFIDKYGEYAKEVHKFIRYSNQVGVLTNNKALYEKEENDIMKQYGASLFITENKKFVSNYNFIICPDIPEKNFFIEKDSYIFTSEKSEFMSGEKMFFDYEVKVPNIYNKFKPRGISDIDFLEAIFYENEFEDLKNMVPKRCRSSYKSVKLQELSRKIKDQFCILAVK